MYIIPETGNSSESDEKADAKEFVKEYEILFYSILFYSTLNANHLKRSTKESPRKDVTRKVGMNLAIHFHFFSFQRVFNDDNKG